MLSGRGRTKIRAPRRGGTSAEEVDFNTTWIELQQSFTAIHTKDASGLSYEQLYRHAYRIVLRKKGDVLYKNVQDFEQKHLSTVVRPHFQSVLPPPLLVHLSPSMGGSTVSERRELGKHFLAQLRTIWEDHRLSMGMIADVLMYMDRVYCADQKRASIYDTSMSQFRNCILFSSADPVDKDGINVIGVLTKVILDQIQMERNGDIIENHLIKGCVYMLEALYIDSGLEVDENKLYNAQFEEEFLEASRKFYLAEGQQMLQAPDAGSYAANTMKRIRQETDRCRSTLLESTTPKIVKVVEDSLIRDQLKDLIEAETGVRYMIDNERLDLLHMIYDLNKRVDENKTELTKAVTGRILELGADLNKGVMAVSAVSSDTTADGGKVSAAGQQTLAALKWVEEVLQLKDRFDNILGLSFEGDLKLQTAQNRSFHEFINSQLFSRSAEYISLFIDENMKKGIKGKSENEIDTVLEKAITLLRYVQDKDLFERYYKKHLCKRLLMNKSLSNDVEKQMISRMKIELGNNFTLKLEAMFRDMTISGELTTGYKEHVARLGDADPRRVELAINVLTSMTWPLESMSSNNDREDQTKKMQCNYPGAIERIKLGFEKYYSEKHSGRKLTWQANLGTADIRATFPGKDGTKERKHELNVSTYAMIILMLFNDVPARHSLSFEEIQARTNIPKNELVRNLQSLAIAPKTRILIKEPMSKDIRASDQFLFNEGFQGKFHKIKIGVVMAANRVEGEAERRDTQKRNDDSRGFCIEAALVRIMKQRKELTHAHLFTETISLLNSQFRPDLAMIKKKVESLIEREYLERIEDENTPSYRYLA
ncbi:Cullin-domain-containing protein [Aulographum hederae CBS 113979]|uniref:Cullin-domain-containing protein n=1 Tax=Aulographum hederae CBS 113979 TaxID=1176131 RepID=A0A6G1GTN4_9PEZI|nr:Cullin-domain-containing protein [Aulographum hederae CBS 113979]